MERIIVFGETKHDTEYNFVCSTKEDVIECINKIFDKCLNELDLITSDEETEEYLKTRKAELGIVEESLKNFTKLNTESNNITKPYLENSIKDLKSEKNTLVRHIKEYEYNIAEYRMAIKGSVNSKVFFLNSLDMETEYYFKMKDIDDISKL